MSIITDPSAGSAAGSQGSPGQQGTSAAGSQASSYDFRNALPEDIRSEKSFEPFAKVKNDGDLFQQLARSYHSAQGMIGKKGMSIPDERSTPEDRAAFNKAMGVPDKPDDYQFETPEGYTPNKDRIAAWRKELHDAGIPAKAANKLVGNYIKEEQASHAAEKSKVTDWENATRQEFGGKLDGMLNSVNYALREIDQNGEIFKILDSTGLGSNKDVIRMLANVGEMLGERGPRGVGTSVSHTLAPDQAQVEIKQLERTHQEALFNNRHPDHEYAVKRRGELYAAAYPSNR